MTPLRALSAQIERDLGETFRPLGVSVSTLYGSAGVEVGRLVNPHNFTEKLQREPAEPGIFLCLRLPSFSGSTSQPNGASRLWYGSDTEQKMKT